MSLGVYNGAVLNVDSGVALAPNAEIRVYREDTGALASIFEDADGTTAITNGGGGFLADAKGRFTFCAAPVAGGFKIEVYQGGVLKHTLRNELVLYQGEVGSEVVGAETADAARTTIEARKGADLSDPVATTSGTSIDFTDIPSWVKKITIQFAGVSINGTSPPIVQIGDSGGLETSGYLGAAVLLSNEQPVQTLAVTAGFGVTAAIGDASVLHGAVTLTRQDDSTNTWVATSTMGYSNAAQVAHAAGSKALSATLDRLRITTVGGTDAFDAGSVSVLVE